MARARVSRQFVVLAQLISQNSRIGGIVRIHVAGRQFVVLAQLTSQASRIGGIVKIHVAQAADGR